MTDAQTRVVPVEAIKNLTDHQQQLDMDGCMVGVSRQALDETLAYVAALNAAPAAPVPGEGEAVAWRYPVLSARDEAIAAMARAVRNGQAWPAVFAPGAAEKLAEDALNALEARPAPSLSRADAQWLDCLLERHIEGGHCGEGSLERQQRRVWNERIERVRATLSRSTPEDGEG